MYQFKTWLEKAIFDEDLIPELQAMDEKEKEDAFYRDLEFGTGGLRGVIGAGTNRMNVYTVAKASQGLSNYINKNFKDHPSIAISRDSRIKSDLFASVAASIFVENGIHVYIYEEIMPTPCLSFAVRELSCSAGIMITASHNPAKYNGYKVYGADGCQITTQAAKEIQEEIDALDIFEDCKIGDFEKGLKKGNIEYIKEEVYTKFIEHVKKESVLYGDEVDKEVSIVYTPLNGTGLKPVLRALKESGYSHITVVKEQEQPDGHFPTCPFPNPEIHEAMALGMEYAERENADLLIATDPDCDRVGIAVKGKDGSYQLLSGNQTGALLLDYICTQRRKHNQMPENPVFIKTIVTSEMAKEIAFYHGVETIDVLTGFKFIGEQIGFLEKQKKENDYICGFEESYGYLTGTYVRDKDAVNGSYMITEMFAYYKTRGISLLEKLEALYQQYGYSLNTLYSYQFEGSKGQTRMNEIITQLRQDLENQTLTEIVGIPIQEVRDYKKGLDGLPKSNVLKLLLKGGHTLVIRPSGTEPKMKAYLSIKGDSKEHAQELENKIHAYMDGICA
ncbi:MAG: phospho-sugar mutase [Solobacterium sp.]|nr:phospho-sugar mutase [Solobacterium sp.]